MSMSRRLLVAAFLLAAAAGAYAEKCRALRASPPAGAWDGVWRMTSK